jgi:hypothetical protein
LLSRLRFGVGLMLAMSAVSVLAGRPTMNECLEGSDFIRNAALSRDAGIAADTFIEHLQGDFLAIRAFPAELRWFVHDEGDEAFLAEQVRLVFDQPSGPDDHQLRFLHACVDRMADG